MDPLAEASKDAATQTATAPVAPIHNPLMPPSKQERILIWRTEVASALSIPPSSHSDSTSSAGSHGTDDIEDDARPSPEPISPLSPTSIKSRSFWRRISMRFSRHRHSPALGPDAQRTSMYRSDRPRPVTGAEAHNENDSFPDRFSDEGAGNGLRDKQERLQRAARLLNQGMREDEGAAIIKAQGSGNGQNIVA